jgi:arsenate reductase-like glutaredoxin family protein
MIENQPRELTLIYHSEKSDDKKARGYVQSLRDVTIKTLDLAKESMTETQLAQLADKIEIPIEELIDVTYDDRSDTAANKEGLKKMDRTEILTMIKQNPKLLSTPILIIGDRAYKYGSAYHLIKDNMDEGIKTTSKSVNAEERDI